MGIVVPLLHVYQTRIRVIAMAGVAGGFIDVYQGQGQTVGLVFVALDDVAIFVHLGHHRALEVGVHTGVSVRTGILAKRAA
jgi:hypothetical protein